MKENKKRWVVIMFPNGIADGKMTVGISSEYVVDAETAKQLIDNREKEYENNKIYRGRSTDTKRAPKI